MTNWTGTQNPVWSSGLSRPWPEADSRRPEQKALDVNCWQLLAAANRCRSHCSIVRGDKTWSRWSSACCFYHFEGCNTLLALSPRQISRSLSDELWTDISCYLMSEPRAPPPPPLTAVRHLPGDGY